MRAGKQPRTSMELETTEHLHPVRGAASMTQRPPPPSRLLALVFGANSWGQAALCLPLKTGGMSQVGGEGIWLSAPFCRAPLLCTPGGDWPWAVLVLAGAGGGSCHLCQGRGSHLQACGDSQ